MEFLNDPTALFFISLVALAIACWILHEVVKSAVYIAIMKAKTESNPPQPNSKPIIDSNFWTEKQIELQRKYDKGEITIEEYKEEFNRV